MKGFVLIFIAVFTAYMSGSDQMPKKAPTVVSAKTVSFVTFLSGSTGIQLLDEAADYFKKWKRYQVVSDPAQADLIVLVGPMPRHVSEEVFDAVVSGKPAPELPNLSEAQGQFAVFDGAELRSPDSSPVRPLWSTEMAKGDLRAAVKKYKRVVDETSDAYSHDRDLLSKCLQLGERCQQ